MKLNGYIFIASGLVTLAVDVGWLLTGDRPNSYMRGGMSGFWLSTAVGAVLLISGIAALLLARRHR